MGSIDSGVRFHSMTLMMANYMAPGATKDGYFERALERLACAVVVEAKERARCRDVDVTAATRVRSW